MTEQNPFAHVWEPVSTDGATIREEHVADDCPACSWDRDRAALQSWYDDVFGPDGPQTFRPDPSTRVTEIEPGEDIGFWRGLIVGLVISITAWSAIAALVWRILRG